MKFRANITKILRFGKSYKEKKGEMCFDLPFNRLFFSSLYVVIGYLGAIRQQKIATL